MDYETLYNELLEKYTETAETLKTTNEQLETLQGDKEQVDKLYNQKSQELDTLKMKNHELLVRIPTEPNTPQVEETPKPTVTSWNEFMKGDL